MREVDSLLLHHLEEYLLFFYSRANVAGNGISFSPEMAKNIYKMQYHKNYLLFLQIVVNP